MKVAALHYNEARRHRAHPWIEATRLPSQMQKELKVHKLPLPSESQNQSLKGFNSMSMSRRIMLGISLLRPDFQAQNMG